MDWPLFSYIVIVFFPAFLSTCGSLIMILSFIMFRKVRSKKSLQTLLFIALSDFFSSLSILFGFQNSNSLACQIQGAMCSFFLTSSLLWTVVVSIQLNYLIRFRKMFQISYFIHAICWIVSFSINILPLISLQYGFDDDILPEGLCLVLWGHSAASNILNVSFFILLWIFIPLMAFLHVWSYYLATNIGDVKLNQIFQLLKFYPLILGFLWIFPTIFLSISLFYPQAFSNLTSFYLHVVSFGFQSLMGSTNFYIFIFRNQTIKKLWVEFLFKSYQKFHKYPKASQNLENCLKNDTDHQTEEVVAKKDDDNDDDEEDEEEIDENSINNTNTIYTNTPTNTNTNDNKHKKNRNLLFISPLSLPTQTSSTQNSFFHFSFFNRSPPTIPMPQQQQQSPPPPLNSGFSKWYFRTTIDTPSPFHPDLSRSSTQSSLSASIFTRPSELDQERVF